MKRNKMDITLCTNTGCPLKEKCRRAKQDNLNTYQSYSLFEPEKNDKTNKWECEFFFIDSRNPQQYLYDTIRTRLDSEMVKAQEKHE